MKLTTEKDAIQFMKTVKLALRYNSTAGLPLASMYQAARDQRRAIELTNALLARKEVVETNVIADRLILVHRDLVPALYTLRIRFRAAQLQADAERAFKLIQREGTATAGDIRRDLGVLGMKRPDRADVALTELQRDMRIDRGPSSVPENGIPYLSKEGYPYRVFEKAHPDLVKIAAKIEVGDAIQSIVEATGSIVPKKLGAMFKLCLTVEERDRITTGHRNTEAGRTS